MEYISYIIMSLLGVILGQVTGHLNKKLPRVVAEEITYKEFFKSLKSDFKIDIKYSAIFLVLFNAFIYFIGNTVTSYLYAIISFSLAVVFSIDFRYRLIPDETHVVILAAGFINFFLNLEKWWDFLLAAIIGGGIFYLLGLISLLIFKKEGMGFGDVKLMASLGFMFGIKNILVITLVSFVFGAIIGGALLIIKRKESDGYIPFGPFIVVATIIVMFVPADYIIDLYITFCGWLGMQMSNALYYFINK